MQQRIARKMALPMSNRKLCPTSTSILTSHGVPTGQGMKQNYGHQN